MEKYYKLAEEKVIETVTTIPENMWYRKGLLPYEQVIDTIEVEVIQKNYSTTEIFKDKVVETLHKYILKPTLEQTKQSKKFEIKEKYVEKSNEGFTCSNGIKLDCRDLDKVNWLTLKMNCLNDPKLITTLKDYDNKIHPGLTCEEVTKMISELEAHYHSLLSGKWTTEQKMFACKTIEEVNLVEWK